MTDYVYIVPAVNGKPTVKLPKFTVKSGKKVESMLKSWTYIGESRVKLVTTKDFDELSEYKVGEI